MKSIFYTSSIFILVFISFKTEAQVLGVSECFSENDAFIGLDRKGWTSQIDDLSESYQIDFQIPEEPPFDCYEIEYVDISIDLSVDQNDISADCFLGYWTHVLDCVDHDRLWKALRSRNVQRPYIDLLRRLHDDQSTTVKTDKQSKLSMHNAE